MTGNQRKENEHNMTQDRKLKTSDLFSDDNSEPARGRSKTERLNAPVARPIRICDLSAFELKRLCEFPEDHEMEVAMETLARVAFYVKDDEGRLRRILKAIKTMQDVMSE